MEARTTRDGDLTTSAEKTPRKTQGRVGRAEEEVRPEFVPTEKSDTT